MAGFRPFRIAHAIGLAAASLLAFTGLSGGAQAQIVRNTATLTFAGAGGDVVVPSNTVEFERGKLPTRISFRQLSADFVVDRSKLVCEPDAGPRFTLQPLTPAQLAAAEPLQSHDIDDPVVLVIESQGGNRDPGTIETVTLTGEAGPRRNIVVLTETGPDTGVFAGASPPARRISGNDIPCDIIADHTGWLTLSFAEDDYSYGSTNALLIDPEGHVFDSSTGAPLDGAVVTLLDDATGQPAQVFGDDGISAYPSSVSTGSRVTDSSGRVYALTPGNFRFPLVAAGRYRLQVAPPPGYVAPSARAPAEMAGLISPFGRPYRLIGGSFGAAFTVAGSAPITVDLPVDPRAIVPARLQPRFVLDKQASVREAEVGDVVQYRVEIRNNGDGGATALTVSDRLPRGLRYKPGSTRGAPEPVVSSDGRTLAFALGALAPGAIRPITYLVEVAPGAPTGEAVNRATAASAERSVSNEASASVRIRPPLFTDGFTIIGRVTEGACGDPERGRKGVAGIRLLMEDGSYVVTDADGLYHFEGVSPGTHVVQIDLASVPASHAPVTCDADTRSGGSAISRFVEAGGGSLQRVDFQLRPTGAAAAAPDALPVTPAADALAAGNRDDWLAQATPGIAWLFPEAEHNPRAPAVRVVLAHGPGQRVALTLNGKPVDALSFDGTDTDQPRGVAISRWTGLPLVEGDNRLEARVLDAGGATVATLTRDVHYANTPARAVYVPEKSRLVADGLTRPLVAVRVLDRTGRPVRAGTIVPFRVEQPYRAAQAAAAEQGRQLAGLERTQASAQVVGDDGLAFVALEPTRQPGLARIAVTLADRERERVSEVKAWLAAPAQDWVVVGFARGTVGYDLLSGAERLERGKRGDLVSDGQIALYAKGRIKGSWLLTIAYDTDKDLERMRERGVLGTIDPDRYYTVYGDGTLQGYDAASRRKLYLRLERREFYALFGDFETGLVDTRLGRYNRTLNGVKAEYTGSRVRATGFAAYDDSRYGRDEIQGNGLSGPYRLSGRNLVPNSDKLRIETRDRLRPELVLDSRQLTRHIDYDIDPGAGTIRFREPILSRDADLNPVFIVADYETEGDGRKLAAGGRAAVTLGRAELGASLIRDETNGTATVAAVDLRARVSETTEIRAEAATGGRKGLDKGRAALAEIEHHGSRADLLAYVRQQDRDFGLGQQNFGEAGTRKIGADGRIRFGERWSLVASAWHQQDLDGPARRVAGEARLEYQRAAGTLYAGTQFASDRGIGGARRESLLLTLGGTQKLFANRLELTGETQLPLGGKDDSVDFPARQRVTAGWRFSEAVRLIAGYEIARGEAFKAQTARIGFDLAPWSGARLMTTLNQGGIGENGSRTYAQYGLSQSLPVGKRWTIDATLDSSRTFAGSIPAGDRVNSYHPVAAGGFLGSDGIDGDFVAATLGATYRGDLWSWNGRGEYRTGPREERLGLTSNLLRSLGNGSTLASSIRAYRLRDGGGAVATSIRADLALALRPLDSRWSLLDRFQIRSESAGAGTGFGNALGVPVLASDTRTTFRAVNNLAVNYRTGGEGAGHGFEASLYYGAKYVRGRYADEKFEGFIDVVGVELRKDIHPRFDLGATASVQHSWSSGAASFAFGPTAGFSPAKDVWLSAGYNLAGYRDRDFEDARWTRQGPFVTMRVKFDQESLGEMVRPLLGGGQ
ncbi:MAG: hypothetical protein WDN24_02525 [Sphingomonas sp.]